MSEGDWYASLQDVHVRVRHGWADGWCGGWLTTRAQKRSGAQVEPRLGRGRPLTNSAHKRAANDALGELG